MSIGSPRWFLVACAIAVPLAAHQFPRPEQLPYTATVVNHRVQTLTDGNVIETTNRQRIARDSQGRTYNENLGSDQQPQTIGQYMIDDPATGGSYEVYPDAQVAIHRPRFGPDDPNQIGIQLRPAPLRAPAPRRQMEQLGQQVIDGVVCNGVRRTQNIQAGQMGNRDPITTVTEPWNSPQLAGRPIRQVTNDPRNGVNTIKLEDLQIGEPPAELFTVPSSYRVVEQPQPSRVVISTSGGRGDR